MTKNKFKCYVKEKIRTAAFNALSLIKEGHKKGSNIVYSKFEMQAYLKLRSLTNDEKSLLFKLRTNMTQVKENFNSMYQNTNCDICQSDIPQSDSHLLDCTKMIEICTSLYEDNETEYLDIFGDTGLQVKATKLFSDIFEAKEKFETSSANTSKLAQIRNINSKNINSRTIVLTSAH